MSIETPDQVKAVVNQKLERERAHEMEQRQEVHRRRMAAATGRGGGGGEGGMATSGGVTSAPVTPGGMGRGIKRSYSHVGVGGPAGSNEPPAKYPAPASSTGSGSTVVRSNLRQIQCVDDTPPPPQRQLVARSAARPTSTVVPAASSSVPTRRISNTNLITLTHNPSPNTITINPGGAGQQQQQRPLSHNGNLVSIPLAAGSGSATKARLSRPPGCRVLVTNLPASATFDRVSQMTTSYGPVKTIQFDNGRAVVEFQQAASAWAFYKDNDKKLMDLSVLSVTRLA